VSGDFLPLAKLQEPLPFWDWFLYLCEAGWKLTLDQYDDLRKSIWLGQIATWQDLAEVSALLWVKPSDGNKQQLFFNETFAAYQKKSLISEPPEPDHPDKLPEKESTSLDKPRPLPKIPWREWPRGADKSLAGIKMPDENPIAVSDKWRLYLTDLPISIEKITDTWRVWQETQPPNADQEIDVERTMAGMSPLGYIEEIVWQPAAVNSPELVVLVDEGENMQTYWPLVSKLFKTIEQKRITPAKIYRFKNYPWRFLYHWKQPGKSVLAADVLKNLSPERTILLVVSDCGAATGLEDEDRVSGTLEFLERWQKSVRPILWLNPVPEDRWAKTPAAAIQHQLGGRMLTLEQVSGLLMRRLVGSRSWPK
jgi:uncharacterized protein